MYGMLLVFLVRRDSRSSVGVLMIGMMEMRMKEIRMLRKTELG